MNFDFPKSSPWSYYQASQGMRDFFVVSDIHWLQLRKPANYGAYRWGGILQGMGRLGIEL